MTSPRRSDGAADDVLLHRDHQPFVLAEHAGLRQVGGEVGVERDADGDATDCPPDRDHGHLAPKRGLDGHARQKRRL